MVIANTVFGFTDFCHGSGIEGFHTNLNDLQFFMKFLK